MPRGTIGNKLAVQRLVSPPLYGAFTACLSARGLITGVEEVIFH